MASVTFPMVALVVASLQLAQAPTQSLREQRCACTIQLQPVGIFGGETDAEGLVGVFTQAVPQMQNRLLARSANPGELLVFDVQEKIPRRIGRKGNGPGEFVTPGLIKVFSGDSVLLYDADNGRVSFFDRELSFVRSLMLPASPYDIIPLLSGNLLVQMHARGAGQQARPIHVVSNNGLVIKSFGVYDPQDPFSRLRALASSRDVLWSARHNRYEIEVWDTAGTLRRTLKRDVSWFQDWQMQSADKLQPTLRDLWYDGRILWVLVTVPDRDWNGPLPEFKDRQSRIHELWDTMIEAVDPTTATVRASLRMPEFMERINGGLVTAIIEQADGVRARVWKLQLNER